MKREKDDDRHFELPLHEVCRPQEQDRRKRQFPRYCNIKLSRLLRV